jgi:hypothetical protein
MNPTTGYYSLIQYCPDAAREEAANVGVVLFCPEVDYLEARTVSGNDRIRASSNRPNRIGNRSTS